MNRRELVRLGWRESSLAYTPEKHFLQGIERSTAHQEQYQSVFSLPVLCFKIGFQEIKDLAETAAQDSAEGVMKILLCRATCPELGEETASSGVGFRLSARLRF